MKLGSTADPAQYEIKQRGYWLVWRDLAANPELAAGIFSVADRLVEDPYPMKAGVPATHLASILPGSESNSEILVVHGPWRSGLTWEQVNIVKMIGPALSLLVGNVLDAERSQRHREQLTAVNGIAEAFGQAVEMDGVLTDVATALAKASGLDWADIRILDSDGETFVERAINSGRFSDTETTALSAEAPFLRRTPFVLAYLRDGLEPYLIPDVFDPEETFAVTETMRSFYRRAHILSQGVFPIAFQGELLGIVQLSSSTPRKFDSAEVSFLRSLVSQTATTVRALQLHRERIAAEAQLRQRDAQLRQSQRLESLGHLSGGIAHNFNNLLLTVMGNADYLLMSMEEEEPLRDIVDEINSGAQRGASLVQQLLAFTKQQELIPRSIDPVAASDDLLRMVTPVLGSTITVTHRSDVDVWPVHMDPGQLNQVLMNLVINARDAMPDGGNITIEYETASLSIEEAAAEDVETGDYVRLIVSDTGIGMDAVTASNVFEPFFSTKPMDEGTGLGLSTVSGIVTQSGGGISLESTVGEGTRFVVPLPRAPSEAT